MQSLELTPHLAYTASWTQGSSSACTLTMQGKYPFTSQSV